MRLLKTYLMNEPSRFLVKIRLVAVTYWLFQLLTKISRLLRKDGSVSEQWPKLQEGKDYWRSHRKALEYQPLKYWIPFLEQRLELKNSMKNYPYSMKAFFSGCKNSSNSVTLRVFNRNPHFYFILLFFDLQFLPARKNSFLQLLTAFFDETDSNWTFRSY